MKMEKSGSSATSRDRGLVAGGEKWEVSYLTKKLGLTKQQVEDAIRQVGNSREKVEEFLLKGKK